MVYVCTILAIGLLAGAIGARDEGVGLRIFWLVCGLLNAAAAAHMVTKDFGYAWRLMPSEEQSEQAYRR